MGGGTKRVYFATDEFFRFYWKDKVFADHALVYADACSSASGQFATICSSAGAGMTLGWTSPVGCQDALLTSNYIFDRLLGTNHKDPGFFKETRPQRPFNWDMITQDMKNHTYPTSGVPPNDKVGTSSTEDGPTTLVAEGAGVFLVPRYNVSSGGRNKQAPPDSEGFWRQVHPARSGDSETVQFGG